ncbi:propionate kinase [Rhodanobacter lindaniclasticus]
MELFAVRIAQSIAAMATGIGGLDHVVFSGGIGHRAPGLRARIVARLGWLGLALAPEDDNAGAVGCQGGSGPAIWNVAIDEERESPSALAWLSHPARSRQHGFSEASYYLWRSKFGGMSVPTPGG